MIKTAFTLAVTSILTVVSIVSHADHEQGFFVGGNAAAVRSDNFGDAAGVDDEVNVPSLELVAGYKYNNWLGLDMRYGSGVESQEEEASGNTIDYNIGNFQSFYYRPEIVNSEAKLYFLIGYTSFEATTEVDDGSTVTETDFSESSTSYGMGAGWFVGDDIVVNVEYRQLVDKDEAEFSVITFGADYRF